MTDMMETSELSKGFKPLASLGGKMVFYSRGSLWQKNNDTMIQKVNMFSPSLKDKVRVLSRLFRREPKWGVAISPEDILFAAHRRIQLVNVATGTQRTLCIAREGFSDPLNVCIECAPWLAVWGDYGPNAECEEINIYGLTSQYQVETVYQFQPGMVRHIHNIVPCLEGGFYILTGDNEKTAGIYKASIDFKDVLPVVIGNQRYRAVVGFDTTDGLLYATDSVNEPNHIFLLDKQGAERVVCDLDGSCIYGIKFGGKYYFSTTVEPDERSRGLLSWFSYKRGEGILSNSVQVLEIDEDLTVNEVLRMEKDVWPMKLMQYGSAQFPRGLDEELWIYPVAVKQYDGSALRLEEQR